MQHIWGSFYKNVLYKFTVITYSSSPDPLAGLGDGAPGKGKEGGRGKVVRGGEQGLF